MLLLALVAALSVARLQDSAPVRIAQPLWNGDTFSIKRGGVSHGGAGALPPYQWSSASSSSNGWFQPHSNTDPDVMGATVVDDPAGLPRKVIKLNADERRSYDDDYVRMEVRGKPLFGPGMDRWWIAEVYVPPGTPTLPTRSAWWTILSISGPPYAGPAPSSFQINRNSTGSGNDLTWRLGDGTLRWRTPATPGWHVVARHIYFSTDATQGYSEVWHSRRGPGGKPTGPLTRQRLTNGSTRWHYATLGPSTWDGTGLDHPDLKNYHLANIFPRRTYVPLYFARHRVYDGATPVEQIDPYYTGML
jgi:hypothetical protein